VIKVNRTISLAADPETVWPFIADPTRFAEWRRGAGVTSAAPIDEARMVVGSRFRMDVTTQGQSGSLECTITALEEHRRFAFESIDKSGFSGSADTRLEAEGNGTQLTFAFELRLPGAWRMMQPVISRVVNQAADADFATLQAKFAP